MRLTFLGTGTSQGMPVIGCNCDTCLSDNPHDKRLRCSACVEVDGMTIVIDTGPDFRQQMLANRITAVDYILYTHEHADHTAGIDDIRPFNFRSKQPMEVYGGSRTLEDIKRRFAYIFREDPYPGAPRVNLNVVSDTFTLQGLAVTPIEVMHGKMPIYGYRIGNLAYLTDVREIADDEISKIKGIDTMVISALHHHPHHSHMNLNQALDMIAKIQPRRTYLIHMGHKMGPEVEWAKRLPPSVYAAYDGLQITISDYID